ncbi:unnamed protein product [Prunus armeniaca]
MEQADRAQPELVCSCQLDSTFNFVQKLKESSSRARNPVWALVLIQRPPHSAEQLDPRANHKESVGGKRNQQLSIALNSIASDWMAKPGPAVPSKIRESTRFYPYFKDCIGAIDGTHIPAMVRGRDVSSYRNRHGKISQNVLAACNFDLEFIYVLSGWEGSAHDSKLLNDALSRRNGLKVPQGKYFLVDCGFPNRRQFLAPFRGVRYHLQDFAGYGYDPQNENELFNLRHASLRNVIERIFGIFKSRFTIFKSAPPFPFKTQAELVLACVALHNFLRKECRSDEFPIEPVDESSSSSVLPVNEEENLEPIVQTQEQQRENANAWRATIALDMWRNAT